MAPKYRWRDPQGDRTLTKIVKQQIPQWKDDLYPSQQNLVKRILDGQNILCCMATGGGKSALFAAPIIVLRETARNRHLYPDLLTRTLPQGIVVTPTKGLAANIVLELGKLGIPAFAYCHETITAARKAGRNLVHEIRECKTWNVICVDPEHLRDKAWREIAAYDIYRATLVFGCGDEIHLINEWGISFRPDFRHVDAFFTGRLPSHISVLGLSATLQPGSATKSVCSSLGMLGDNFYLFRSSNERPNTQFIIETLENGVGGKVFPQLLPYLNSRRKAVIHCRTIDDVLRLLDEDPECQVVIATIAFANGLNVKALLDSISLGFPDTVDQLWQEKGRVGRNPETAARGVVLVQPSAFAAAEKQLAGTSAASATATTAKSRQKKRLIPVQLAVTATATSTPSEPATTAKTKRKKNPKPMEHAKALNPPLETTTKDCITAQRRLPCSLCAVRNNVTLAFPGPALPPGVKLPLFIHPTVEPISMLDKKLKLTAKKREQAEPVLVEFGETVRRAEPLDSVANLGTAAQSWVFSRRYIVRLYVVVHQLRSTINSQRETARVERNAKQRAACQKKKGAYVSEAEDELEAKGESEESDDEIDEHPRSSPVPPSPKRRRRVLEVTNEEQSGRTSKKVARRKPLPGAAEVTQSFSAPYVTSRRRAAQNQR
ncbi:P-loop containing nucleoside triphosphate hydrolase protein [Mycena capillaripes]|nr:P-loop containing nucleoside triphosphate hydrolase protein [Mycena capillaripes]